MVERVNTGIKGLDNYIEDGFPEGSVTLVTGGPGVGKTTFCLNFLEEGLEKMKTVSISQQAKIQKNSGLMQSSMA